MSLLARFFAKPLVPVLALTFICAVGSAVLALRGGVASEGSTLLWRFAFVLCMVRWVELDRRAHRFDAPFEFDAFVFFGWPLVVPYYLFKTRGVRGFVYGLGFWVLAGIPSMTSDLIFLIHGK